MAAETAVEDDLVDVPDRGGSGARDEPPCCGEGFVRNDADKGARSRFSLVCAFKCAWDGIAYAVRTQRNMKIHLGIAVLAVALGLHLQPETPHAQAGAASATGTAASQAEDYYGTARMLDESPDLYVWLGSDNHLIAQE